MNRPEIIPPGSPGWWLGEEPEWAAWVSVGRFPTAYISIPGKADRFAVLALDVVQLRRLRAALDAAQTHLDMAEAEQPDRGGS